MASETRRSGGDDDTHALTCDQFSSVEKGKLSFMVLPIVPAPVDLADVVQAGETMRRASIAVVTHALRPYLPQAGHETPPRDRLLSKTSRVKTKLSIDAGMKNFSSIGPMPKTSEITESKIQ
jgi:hypothetical protein